MPKGGRRLAMIMPLADAFETVRQETLALVNPLVTEDFVIQAMDDVSPPKWHLAHTTWFFETFVLLPFLKGYQAYQPAYQYLFNSYYESVGKYFPRPQRGLLSRPTVQDILQYRRVVDDAVKDLLGRPEVSEEVNTRVELGIHHEQQHQELLVTDLKYNFSINPLYPVYRSDRTDPARPAPDLHWHTFPEGPFAVGFSGDGFAFDNERPRHTVWQAPFQLASRLVTNREYLAFIEAGGYRTPEWWLSEGWHTILRQNWQAPLYWVYEDNAWWLFTLHGLVPLPLHEPVCHVSYFEADAYARWAGYRLPTEAEWEQAALTFPQPQANFLESEIFHPSWPSQSGDVMGLFGGVWEWTSSAYAPYPGFRPLPGALGEYNGKFMVNQYVLRGGSCATPASHIRPTYRNFFPPSARWQFSGIRLAGDVS